MNKGSQYRAEVIGSMLRPEELKAANAQRQEGNLTPAEFKQLEDRAVDEVLAVQERAGVDVVTDGEMRRFVYTAPLTETLDGIVPIDAGAGPSLQWHGDSESDDEELPLPFAIGDRLRRRKSLTTEEFAYVRSRTSKPVKMTLPSPMQLSPWWVPGISDQAYSDPFEAFIDGAQIVRDEIAELVELGCEYVQIDAPELATHVLNEDQRARWEARGIAPERMLHEGVEILNELARDQPIRMALHICRGNFAGKWMGSGGYEAIARQVFRGAANFDAFALEYDSPRAGSFEPLAEVPDDKTVILGFVSTKKDELESAEELRQRIDEAAAVFPRNQLALSSQCGFASGFEGNPIHWETQERKLKLIAEVAHEALAGV